MRRCRLSATEPQAEEHPVGKRVNIDGPGDDPDEIWIECDDCKGEKTIEIPDLDDERFTITATCGGCDGLGFYAGDADDVDD